MQKAKRSVENRKIRQEAIREQLSAYGHIQQVVEIADNLGDKTIDDKDIRRLKAKADIHLALIRKYLPDLKAIEISGDQENPVHIDNKWTIEVVSAKDNDTGKI